MQWLKTVKWISILGCIFVFISSAFAHADSKPLELMGARLTNLSQSTQVSFEFSKDFKFHYFILKHPERVVVDLPGVALKTNLSQLPLKQSLINRIRHGVRPHETLRIVFNTSELSHVRVSALKPKGDYGYRLLIDFQGKKRKHAIRVIHPKIYHGKVGRDIIVVIDPGHGGKDPGATGPKGIHEKNVVLAISKDIEHDIDAIPGMTTKMTRYGDYYITLRDRLRIARKDHADFFVAIHADAFHDRNADGASVFALSQRGATSEAARWLAERENYSELGGVYLANKSRVLRSVLIDLSQTATISQSLHIGRTIVNTMSKVTPMHSRVVEQARFVVLKSPDIPSLLIETGFITNEHEETLLDTPSYQHKIARAIAAGVKKFFEAYPPAETLFAFKKYSVKYRVRKGDTLSKLAEKYEIPAELLLRMNGLKSSQLPVGKMIIVPTERAKLS